MANATHTLYLRLNKGQVTDELNELRKELQEFYDLLPAHLQHLGKPIMNKIILRARSWISIGTTRTGLSR